MPYPKYAHCRKILFFFVCFLCFNVLGFRSPSRWIASNWLAIKVDMSSASCVKYLWLIWTVLSLWIGAFYSSFLSIDWLFTDLSFFSSKFCLSKLSLTCAFVLSFSWFSIGSVLLRTFLIISSSSPGSFSI